MHRANTEWKLWSCLCLQVGRETGSRGAEVKWFPKVTEKDNEKLELESRFSLDQVTELCQKGQTWTLERRQDMRTEGWKTKHYAWYFQIQMRICNSASVSLENDTGKKDSLNQAKCPYWHTQTIQTCFHFRFNNFRITEMMNHWKVFKISCLDLYRAQFLRKLDTECLILIEKKC